VDDVVDLNAVRSARRTSTIGRSLVINFTIPADPAGYDAGKKIKGKKRLILVDTQGLLMHASVHPPTFRTTTSVGSTFPRLQPAGDPSPLANIG
jgi:hypothetical protein